MTPTPTVAATTSSDAGEGPVMALINKRLRALRKKLNRITQMEDSISQGKTLNKEQQEVLRSKPSVLILIEELDKLRAPLSAAVSEEITLATTHHHQQQPPSDQNEVENTPDATATATETASSDAGEGPVMTLINKRLRGLRKKLNRITQMEESISQGKTLNSDQQELLSSKPSVIILIEELDKLRAPLSAAFSEEITLATTPTARPEAAAAAGNYGGFQVAADNEQKEKDASTSKEQESAVNDQSEQPTRLYVSLETMPQPKSAPTFGSIDKGKGKLIKPDTSSSGIYKEQLITPPASSASSRTVGKKMVDAKKESDRKRNAAASKCGSKGAGTVGLGLERNIHAGPVGKSDKKVRSKSSPIDVIALWDKENAPLPYGYPLKDLRANIEKALKTHDQRFVLGQLRAYGPNLPSKNQFGITYISIPRENLPCEVRVSEACLKLVVERADSNLVKIMRCTDIADKYIITDLCLQMLLDDSKHVLIIAGDDDFRTSIEGFRDASFMLAQPKFSSKDLHVTTKATWLWATGDKHDMLDGGQPRFQTAAGYQSSWR